MSDLRLIIRVKDQKAELFQGSELVRTFTVSTAANGVGCETGSLKTPPGLLRVARKFGEGCAIGTVFRERVATGEIWANDPANSLQCSKDDLVLTRILWLEGCEEQNSNTLDRYIYLHGTNQESLLGQPTSHGCVRFSNEDILEVFDLVNEGTPVQIVE